MKHNLTEESARCATALAAAAMVQDCYSSSAKTAQLVQEIVVTLAHPEPDETERMRPMLRLEVANAIARFYGVKPVVWGEG